MTVSVFSCSCDNVILPSFIALIEYQKETKPQVNLKETLSQVNNILNFYFLKKSPSDETKTADLADDFCILTQELSAFLFYRKFAFSIE